MQVLHPSAKTVLGANNLAFTHGELSTGWQHGCAARFTRLQCSLRSWAHMLSCLCSSCALFCPESAGDYHKHIRKSFLSLFTRKALSTYIELQVGTQHPAWSGAHYMQHPA